MSNIFLKSLFVSPAILGTVLAIAAPSFAADAKATEDIVSTQEVVSGAAALGSDKELAVSADSTSLTASTPAANVEQTASQPAPAIANTSFDSKLAQAVPVAPAASTPEADTSTLDQLNQYVREGRANKANQVTSVSQFSDVRPTDWAFQALQSLVERYGCIVGYPNKTYRGNRAMTRYEFAAGLNACLDKIQELIAAATADFVKKEDLEVVKKLQEEFAAELAALRGRVDGLEVRTATLEKQQFSTTTKLSGEVIFAVTDEFAQPGDNETVFQDRVRLVLSSSFSGRDQLIVRLAAGNANAFSEFNRAGTNQGDIIEGSQTFNLGNTGGNAVVADWVAYYFPLGENIQVYVPAFAGLWYDLFPTHAAYLEDYDGGNGALSLFAQRNPIYDIGGGAGAAATLGVGKPISLSLGYMADAANLPDRGNGLFDGGYTAMGQLNFTPNDKFSLGLTYVNSFRKEGTGIFNFGGASPLVGSIQSNFLSGLDLGGPEGTVVNGGGLSAALKFSPKFAINGWVSYFRADALRDGVDEYDIWTYALALSFPDFGKKGNLLGLMAGTEPYTFSNVSRNRRETPIHVEGFYRIRLNDNISITPGVIWILNPSQTDDKDSLIGTVRTTFTF